MRWKIRSTDPIIRVQSIMNEHNLTVADVANSLKMTKTNVSAVVNGRAGIGLEMAVYFSAAFGNSTIFWTNLQNNYELWHAERKAKRPKIRYFKLPRNRQSTYAL